MTAIINWTPVEFVSALTATWVICILSTGIVTTFSELCERTLRQWWTGKKIK